MLGALEKWLASKAADVGSLRRLSTPQLIGKGARKTAEGVKDSYQAIKANPKLAAGAGGVGAALGLGLGGDAPPEDNFEEELRLLREKYGL
jgi:hypothetical protein